MSEMEFEIRVYDCNYRVLNTVIVKRSYRSERGLRKVWRNISKEAAHRLSTIHGAHEVNWSVKQPDDESNRGFSKEELIEMFGPEQARRFIPQGQLND
jgi:hypothetical protein